MEFKVIYKEVILESVNEHPNNPQVVSEEKMLMMSNYMKKHGWVGQAPLCWLNMEDNKLYWISGHHRARAAIMAGIEKRDCEVIVDERYNWDQANKDLLMYNNIHGDPNEDLEKDVIKEIMKNEEDIEKIAVEIGRSVEEIKDILYEPEFEPINEDEQPLLGEKRKVQCPFCNEEFEI